MNIRFAVQPASDVVASPTVSLTVEVNYLRNSSDDDGSKVLVPSSVRFELDASLKAATILEDADPDWLEANVLSVDGSSVLKRVLKVTSDSTVLLTLSAKDVSLIETGRQVVPVDTTPLTVVRTVRLVSTGTVKVNFRRSTVAVVPIVDGAQISASNVDVLLKMSEIRTSSLEVTGQDLSLLNTLVWTSTHLAVDGTFTALFTQQDTVGWLWWLIGDQQVLGFVPDNLAAADNKTLVIALPVLSDPLDMGVSTPENNTDSDRSVPANVTEAEVANNPGIYAEDPGAFCRPFSNPERVLSERTFSVIARVTQPEIGPLSSVKTKMIGLLNLDGNAGNSGSSGGSTVRRLLDFIQPRGITTLPAALADSITPARHNLVGRYVDLLKRLPSGRMHMDANHPIQWEDDIAQYQATTVAIGHILEFRVRWRSNGYSLGTVAKTLTLAPRQTKRIQKIEWERSERAQRRETTQLRDQENDSIVRERDYSDSVAAGLSEWASGGSSSNTKAIAGGIGFAIPFVVGGVGGGASSANSTSHQEGGRDTTASELQRLRDAIRRHGDALRKFESSVVNEVTQEETVTGTTEVIRNANYAHSLTVIYYQILRHLKVTTEFAGVRECIFVPFAIKPFDLQRAYRWRETLQAFIRSPLYSRALRYLKDVATNFTTSDIAAGSRAGQQLTYLRGSIYVSLGIERPRDTADGQFDPNRWQIVQPLLATPALEIFSVLAAQSATQRDRSFQTEYAPSIAAGWANKLQLRAGSRVLRADCTLASRYQFNRSVRIDFAIPSSELMGLSRQALQQIIITSGQGLPPGSVANLTRISITYNTNHFEHAVEGHAGTNDLVTPVNGAADNAMVILPLDSWERVDERLEIRRSVNQLIEHLNEHVVYYTKAALWGMDRDQLLIMLDGFYVPNTNNVSIASVVDREPVAIIGNCLVYRVGAASFLGYGKVTTPAELYNIYAQREPVSDPLLISLPTDGLYAQTIMDECDALEEHYGNTDWVLNDQEPDLGAIDPSLLQSRRTDQTSATTPTAFPNTIINLQNAPEAPAPNGLAGVLNAVTNPNAFRDMAGLAGTQANAQAALNTAASLATNFGNQAAALELAKLAKAQQATRTADQKIASIKRAQDKGLTTPADAAQATKDTLSAMNPDAPRAEAPHENAAINSAIDTVKNIPGSMIEASTGEGSVRVTTGSGGPLLASLDQSVPQFCAFWDVNSAPINEIDLREEVRAAAEAERNLWFNAAGTAIEEDASSQYGHLVSYWLGRFSDIPPVALAALQAKAVDGTINYGQLPALTTLPNNLTAAETATLNAEAVQIRTALMTAVVSAVPATVSGRAETAVRNARLSGVLLPENDPVTHRSNRSAWSAIFVVSTIRKVAANLGLEAEVGGVHNGKDVLLLGHEGHRIYVGEAFRRRAAGIAGTYHSFETTERAVQVGDIIAQDRQANSINNVWKYADMSTLASVGREMHCDIVVEVPPGGDHVVTIGGNIGNSVRRRRYPVSADGKLVVSREQYYTQESDTGVLAPIPAPNTANGLASLSTGRIFALLSPVPLCIVVPGTRVDGGVVT